VRLAHHNIRHGKQRFSRDFASLRAFVASFRCCPTAGHAVVVACDEVFRLRMKTMRFLFFLVLGLLLGLLLSSLVAWLLS
jgi:hypothetical protein